MFQRLLHSRCFKMIAVFVLVAYLSSIPSQSGYAQTLTPAPGQMLATSPALNPPVMMGMRVDVKNPFNLYFIMKDGDHKLEQQERELEYRKLIKYFMASLVIPNQDMWVNLSPRESERIIPDNFSMTEMGRDLLEQDYLLKQFTSSLLFPESSPGKEFWSRIYARAYARFGTTDIPVDTFNKVWITADKADIYQKNDTAILVKSHLKVMLEQDFLAGRDTAVKQSAGIADAGVAEPSSQMASDVMRDVVIPVIEQEVNTGAHFAALRQAYNSMIMATWFKQNLKNSLLGQVYADTGKVGGIELNDPQSKERIYRQYMEAYKAGVFNYVKEEWDAGSRELLPRKYFSGGITAIGPDIINPAVSFAEAMAVVAPAAAAISVTSVGLQTTDGAMITAPVSASATQQKKAAASVAAKRQWVQNRLQRVRQLIATTRRQLADARQKRLARGKAETMWFEWAPGDYFQGIRGAQPLDIAARMVLQMQAYVPVRTGAPFATLDNVRAWHDQIYGKADNIVQAHRNAARWLVETDLPFRGLAAMAAKGALTSKQRAALQVELLKARVSFKDLADEAVVARLSRGALGRDIKKAILRELYGFRTTSDRFSTAASPKTWSPSFMSLRLMGAYALTEFSRIWQSRGKSSRTSVFGWRKWVLSLMLALQVSSAVAPAAAAIVQQAPVPTPVAEVQTTPPAAGPDMLHLPDVLAVSGAETTSGQAAAQSDQTKITLVDRFNAGGVLTAAPGELVSARELGIGLINTAQGLRNLSDLDARVLLREYTASDADMKDMVVRTVLYQGKRMVVAAYTDSTVSRSDKGPSARLGARAASGVSGAVAAGTPVVAPAATPAETQSLQVIDRFTGQVQEQTVDLKDGTWRQLGENDLLTKRTLQVAGSAKVFRAGTWIRLQAAQDLGTDLPQGVRPANGKVITAYIEPTASSESSSVPSVQPSADTADAGRRTLLPVAAGRATLDEEAEYYRSIESMDELSDLESKVSAMYFSIQYAETAGLDNPWIRTFGDPKSGKVSSAAFPVQITYTLARDNVRRGRMSKESADFFRQVLEPIYKKFFQHTGKIGTPGYDPRFDYGGTGGFDPVKFGPAYKKFAKELIRLHLQDAKGNERRALAAWRGATEQEDPRYFQRYDTAREAVRKAPGRMEIAEELADVVETLAQRRTQAAEMRREQEQNRKARQTYEQEQARSKARVAEEKKKTFTQQHMFLTQEMRRLQALGGVGFDAQDLPASLTWVMDYNYPLASVPLGTPSGDPSLGFMLNINHPFKSIAEATQIAKGFGGTVNGAPISDISTVLGPLRLLDIGMELYNYGLMHPNRNQTKLYHTDKDPIQGIINTLTINWTDVEAANEENQMQRKTVFSVGLYDSLRAIPGFFDRITFKGVTPLWQLMGNVNLRFPFENAGDQMQYGLYQMAFEYAAANKPAARDDVVFVELFEVTDPNTKYVRNEENGYDVQPTAQGEDKVHYRGTVKGYMLRLQSDGQVQAREVFSSPAFLTHGFIKAEAGAQAGLRTVIIKPLVSRESLANEMAVLEGKTADGKKVYGGLRHPVSGEMVRVITDSRELNLLQQLPAGGQYLPKEIGKPLTPGQTRAHTPRSFLQEAGAVIVDYTGDQLRMTLRSWRNMLGKPQTLAERADKVDFDARPLSEDLRVKGFAATKVNGYMFQAGQLLQDIEAEGEAMSGWVRHFDGTLSEPVSGTSQFKVVKWLKPAEFEVLRKTAGAQKTETGISVTIDGVTYQIDDSVLIQLPSSGKKFGIFDPSSRTKKLWYDQLKAKEQSLAIRYAGYIENEGVAVNVATGKLTALQSAADFRPARFAGPGIVGQKVTIKGDTEPVVITGDMMVKVSNGRVTDLFEPGIRNLEHRLVVLQTRFDGGFEIENRATGKFEIYAKGNDLTAEQKAAGIKPESELVKLMVDGRVKAVPVDSSRPEGEKRLIILDPKKDSIPARRLLPGGAPSLETTPSTVTAVAVPASAPGILTAARARLAAVSAAVVKTYDGFFRKQANPQTGLSASHIGDEDSFKKYGSQSYDQFLRAILGAGSPEALRIMRTYAANNSEARGENAPATLETRYSPANGILNNIRISNFDQKINGEPWFKTWEFRVTAGDNAWGGLAAVYNYVAANDPALLQFARERADFLLALQDADGGVRFGPKGQFREDNDPEFFWKIKSTENNQSALYFLDNLYRVTGDMRYARAADKIYNWLMTRMYDPVENVFHRGEVFKDGQWHRDPLGKFAPDNTAWAPLERMLTDTRLGATRSERLSTLDSMISKTEYLGGVYEGKTLKGFSYSPEAKSRGIISPEWSSQMAVLYKRMSEEHADPKKKADYQARYEALKTEVGKFYTQKDGGLVAPYAVFKDGRIAANQPTGHDWNTPNAEASVAGIYYAFAESGINPLTAVALEFVDKAKPRQQPRSVQSRLLPSTMEEFTDNYYMIRWKSDRPHPDDTVEGAKNLDFEFATKAEIEANREAVMRQSFSIEKLDGQGNLVARLVKLRGVEGYSEIPEANFDAFLRDHFIVVLKGGRGGEYVSIKDFRNPDIYSLIKQDAFSIELRDKDRHVLARAYLSEDIRFSDVELIGSQGVSGLYHLLDIEKVVPAVRGGVAFLGQNDRQALPYAFSRAINEFYLDGKKILNVELRDTQNRFIGMIGVIIPQDPNVAVPYTEYQQYGVLYVTYFPLKFEAGRAVAGKAIVGFSEQPTRNIYSIKTEVVDGKTVYSPDTNAPAIGQARLETDKVISPALKASLGLNDRNYVLAGEYLRNDSDNPADWPLSRTFIMDKGTNKEIGTVSPVTYDQQNGKITYYVIETKTSDNKRVKYLAQVSSSVDANGAYTLEAVKKVSDSLVLPDRTLTEMQAIAGPLSAKFTNIAAQIGAELGLSPENLVFEPLQETRVSDGISVYYRIKGDALARVLMFQAGADPSNSLIQVNTGFNNADVTEGYEKTLLNEINYNRMTRSWTRQEFEQHYDIADFDPQEGKLAYRSFKDKDTFYEITSYHMPFGIEGTHVPHPFLIRYVAAGDSLALDIAKLEGGEALRLMKVDMTNDTDRPVGVIQGEVAKNIKEGFKIRETTWDYLDAEKFAYVYRSLYERNNITIDTNPDVGILYYFNSGIVAEHFKDPGYIYYSLNGTPIVNRTTDPSWLSAPFWKQMVPFLDPGYVERNQSAFEELYMEKDGLSYRLIREANIGGATQKNNLQSTLFINGRPVAVRKGEQLNLSTFSDSKKDVNRNGVIGNLSRALGLDKTSVLGFDTGLLGFDVEVSVPQEGVPEGQPDSVRKVKVNVQDIIAELERQGDNVKVIPVDRTLMGEYVDKGREVPLYTNLLKDRILHWGTLLGGLTGITFLFSLMASFGHRLSRKRRHSSKLFFQALQSQKNSSKNNDILEKQSLELAGKWALYRTSGNMAAIVRKLVEFEADPQAAAKSTTQTGDSPQGLLGRNLKASAGFFEADEIEALLWLYDKGKLPIKDIDPDYEDGKSGLPDFDIKHIVGVDTTLLNNADPLIALRFIFRKGWIIEDELRKQMELVNANITYAREDGKKWTGLLNVVKNFLLEKALSADSQESDAELVLLEKTLPDPEVRAYRTLLEKGYGDDLRAYVRNPGNGANVKQRVERYVTERILLPMVDNIVEGVPELGTSMLELRRDPLRNAVVSEFYRFAMIDPDILPAALDTLADDGRAVPDLTPEVLDRKYNPNIVMEFSEPATFREKVIYHLLMMPPSETAGISLGPISAIAPMTMSLVRFLIDGLKKADQQGSMQTKAEVIGNFKEHTRFWKTVFSVNNWGAMFGKSPVRNGLFKRITDPGGTQPRLAIAEIFQDEYMYYLFEQMQSEVKNHPDSNPYRDLMSRMMSNDLVLRGSIEKLAGYLKQGEVIEKFAGGNKFFKKTAQQWTSEVSDLLNKSTDQWTESERLRALALSSLALQWELMQIPLKSDGNEKLEAFVAGPYRDVMEPIIQKNQKYRLKDSSYDFFLNQLTRAWKGDLRMWLFNRTLKQFGMSLGSAMMERGWFGLDKVFNKEGMTVDYKNRTVKFSDGEIIHYNRQNSLENFWGIKSPALRTAIVAARSLSLAVGAVIFFAGSAGLGLFTISAGMFLLPLVFGKVKQVGTSKGFFASKGFWIAHWGLASLVQGLFAELLFSKGALIIWGVSGTYITGGLLFLLMFANLMLAFHTTAVGKSFRVYAGQIWLKYWRNRTIGLASWFSLRPIESIFGINFSGKFLGDSLSQIIAAQRKVGPLLPAGMLVQDKLSDDIEKMSAAHLLSPAEKKALQASVKFAAWYYDGVSSKDIVAWSQLKEAASEYQEALYEGANAGIRARQRIKSRQPLAVDKVIKQRLPLLMVTPRVQKAREMLFTDIQAIVMKKPEDDPFAQLQGVTTHEQAYSETFSYPLEFWGRLGTQSMVMRPGYLNSLLERLKKKLEELHRKDEFRNQSRKLKEAFALGPDPVFSIEGIKNKILDQRLMDEVLLDWLMDTLQKDQEQNLLAKTSTLGYLLRVNADMRQNMIENLRSKLSDSFYDKFEAAINSVNDTDDVAGIFRKWAQDVISTLGDDRNDEAVRMISAAEHAISDFINEILPNNLSVVKTAAEDVLNVHLAAAWDYGDLEYYNAATEVFRTYRTLFKAYELIAAKAEHERTVSENLFYHKFGFYQKSALLKTNGILQFGLIWSGNWAFRMLEKFESPDAYTPSDWEQASSYQYISTGYSSFQDLKDEEGSTLVADLKKALNEEIEEEIARNPGSLLLVKKRDGKNEKTVLWAREMRDFARVFLRFREKNYVKFLELANTQPGKLGHMKNLSEFYELMLYVEQSAASETLIPFYDPDQDDLVFNNKNGGINMNTWMNLGRSWNMDAGVRNYPGQAIYRLNYAAAVGRHPEIVIVNPAFRIWSSSRNGFPGTDAYAIGQHTFTQDFQRAFRGLTTFYGKGGVLQPAGNAFFDTPGEDSANYIMALSRYPHLVSTQFEWMTWEWGRPALLKESIIPTEGRYVQNVTRFVEDIGLQQMYSNPDVGYNVKLTNNYMFNHYMFASIASMLLIALPFLQGVSGFAYLAPGLIFFVPLSFIFMQSVNYMNFFRHWRETGSLLWGVLRGITQVKEAFWYYVSMLPSQTRARVAADNEEFKFTGTKKQMIHGYMTRETRMDEGSWKWVPTRNERAHRVLRILSGVSFFLLIPSTFMAGTVVATGPILLLLTGIVLWMLSLSIEFSQETGISTFFPEDLDMKSFIAKLSFEFQAADFQSLDKIEPLLIKLGQSKNNFNDINTAVKWLNESIEPFQQYIDYIETHGTAEHIARLLPDDFVKLSLEKLEKLAQDPKGQELKEEILRELYPNETPVRRKKDVSDRILWGSLARAGKNFFDVLNTEILRMADFHSKVKGLYNKDLLEKEIKEILVMAESGRSLHYSDIRRLNRGILELIYSKEIKEAARQKRYNGVPFEPIPIPFDNIIGTAGILSWIAGVFLTTSGGPAVTILYLAASIAALTGYNAYHVFTKEVDVKKNGKRVLGADGKPLKKLQLYGKDGMAVFSDYPVDWMIFKIALGALLVPAIVTMFGGVLVYPVLVNWLLLLILVGSARRGLSNIWEALQITRDQIREYTSAVRAEMANRKRTVQKNGGTSQQETDSAQMEQQEPSSSVSLGTQQADKAEQGLMLQAYARGRALETYQGYLEKKLNSLPDAAAVAQDVEQQGLVQQDPDQLGGISFNENSLVINLKVDGDGVPLPADMQSPEVVSIAGLTPVIRDISPVTSRNVPVLMELMRGAAL